MVKISLIKNVLNSIRFNSVAFVIESHSELKPLHMFAVIKIFGIVSSVHIYFCYICLASGSR